jgi:hypothetical protein
MIERMVENVSQFRTGPFSGGAGPHFPDLEARIAQLEAKVDKIDTTTRSIEVSLAEIKGRLSQAPTWLQLIIATWGAGAAIVAGSFDS